MYEGQPLLRPESFKTGLRALSKQRVEDTLIAEAGEFSYLIEKFRNGKAEHNETTVGDVLGRSGEELMRSIQFLRDIGFLEAVGSSYKIPIIYQDGLNITQGKAFDSDAEMEIEEEE